MKKIVLILLLIITSCQKKEAKKEIKESKFKVDLVLSFGSCNNQNIENKLFKEILKNKPEAFIWGGDIIYSDTDKPQVLATNFKKFKEDSTYKNFAKKTKILGTWDDHDYGINDGGYENPIKQEAQHILLDFLDVPKNDKRREQEGVYYSETIKKDNNTIKIILLDTRYFRTELTKDPTGKKRYIPTTKGTMLGETQWQWLEKELETSTAEFNIIVSSIQFLSNKHGFETWGNMPNEVEKLKNIILKTKAKNTIILSGDRHIAEISKIKIGTKKPLIDFTSSGLTHAYTGFTGEENPFRINKVVHEINFGLLKFDFKNKKVLFEIRGLENKILETFTQQY